MQADRLESQMRSLLEIQEGVDLCLEQRDEELHQLRSQSQADGAQLAALSLQLQELSRIQLLTSKISHICQEICDIKEARKAKSNLLWGTSTSTNSVEAQTSTTSPQEQTTSSSAREDSSDEDDWGGTYSPHSTLCPHEPSNPYN